MLGGGASVPELFNIPEHIVNAVSTGGRPALYSEYFSSIHDRHVIGVNNAYMIGSWIDAVFFGDCAWYNVHRQNLAKYNGLKVTCCNRFENRPADKMEGIRFLQKDAHHRQGLTRNTQKVSWNTNSGAAAINLGVHLGAKRIIIMGLDMNMKGQHSHWHGSHGNKKPPPFSRHLRGFPDIKKDAAEMEVEILNTNPHSGLKGMFPIITMEEALALSTPRRTDEV